MKDGFRRMMKVSLRTVAALCTLTLLVTGDGCRRHRKSKSAPNTTKYAENVQKIVEKRVLPKELLGATENSNLRWPDFSDYQPIVAQFYDDRNYEVAWTRDDAPTASTTAFIKAFQDAGAKGLIPEDYDGSRWAARIQKLNIDKSADAISAFDVAMTVNVMRYISDLRIGRVNPSHFNFGINVSDKKYDLAEFVSDNAVDATDVPGLIAKVEPDSEQYRKSEAALAHYLELEKLQTTNPREPLPAVTKPLSVGDLYLGGEALEQRLAFEGDGLITAGASDGTLSYLRHLRLTVERSLMR